MEAVIESAPDISLPVPVAANPPELQSIGAEPPGLLETSLPDNYHAAYRKRLQGIAVGSIADEFGVDRTTVWRWCRAVETEYVSQLESQPRFNMIAEQLKRLRDIEENCRGRAEAAKSERAAAMFLATGLKAVQAQCELLLQVGIFERAPDKLFQVIASVKPKTDAEGEQKPGDHRSREEIIANLIYTLSKSAQL